MHCKGKFMLVDNTRTDEIVFLFPTYENMGTCTVIVLVW